MIVSCNRRIHGVSNSAKIGDIKSVCEMTTKDCFKKKMTNFFDQIDTGVEY